MKAPRAAGTGIQPEHTVSFLLHIFMRVAKHDHIHTRKVFRHFLFVVHHEKCHTVQRDGQVVRNGFRPILIVVAADNIQRRILPQLVHNALFVDVAAMQNDVDGFQTLGHLRPQQTVRIR